MTATAPADPRQPARAGRSRVGAWLTALLVLPAALWYIVLLVAAARRSSSSSASGPGQRTAATRGGFTFDNYAPCFQKPEPFVTSLIWRSPGRSVPARRVAARVLHRDAGRQAQERCFILLLVIPFWTSFLIRTYAWLIILGPDGAWPGFLGALTGDESSGSSARRSAVLIGLVYGYLPLMVFPLYVTLERMDRTLGRGVQGPGRRPLGDLPPDHPAHRPARAGDRQHPRVHPDDGRVRHPADPRATGRAYLMGNALVLDFLEARNWPSGSARAVVPDPDHARDDRRLPVVR